MKRFVNPDVDTLNEAYRADVKQYDGFTDSDQIIYLVSKKELAHLKHYSEVLYAA